MNFSELGGLIVLASCLSALLYHPCLLLGALALLLNPCFCARKNATKNPDLHAAS